MARQGLKGCEWWRCDSAFGSKERSDGPEGRGCTRACFGRTESEGSLQNQGIPAGLLMGESIGIDSVLEAKRCQVRILPRCESESSQELRVVLRGARLPNILRSAPAQRSNGCSAGTMTEVPRPHRAEEALRLWRSTRIGCSP